MPGRPLIAELQKDLQLQNILLQLSRQNPKLFNFYVGYSFPEFIIQNRSRVHRPFLERRFEEPRQSDFVTIKIKPHLFTMKTTIIALAAAALLCGCTSTIYEKSISVTKDASGRITSTTETEKALQRGTGIPIQFDLLPGVQPFGNPAPAKTPRSP